MGRCEKVPAAKTRIHSGVPRACPAETIVTDAIGAEDRARLEESGVEVLTAE